MTFAAAFKPLTKEDIADVLGISLRTVENWVNEGTLLSPKKIGNRVYWHPTAFYAWLDRCLADTAADKTASSIGQGSREAAGVKTAPRKKDAKEANSELVALRNRNSAKLDALLNA